MKTTVEILDTLLTRAERAVALARSYRLDDPRDPSTTMGPMVRADAADSVQGQGNDAIRSGAKSLVDPSGFPAETSDVGYRAALVR
ncbi:MAG: aldehyde dehydrogenase family protein [Longimicrobiales bacterium]